MKRATRKAKRRDTAQRTAEWERQASEIVSSPLKKWL
jgi:hypothetical protein